MTPQDFNPPDLTAYAMGELPTHEAARVRHYLDQSPEARAELEQIQVMLTALNQAPPIPVRALHPRQRETVLSMGQTPAVPVAASSRSSRVVPFRPPQSRVPYARPAASVGWTLFKYATAASLTVGAFFLGQKTSNSLNGGFLTNNQAPLKDLVDPPTTQTLVEGTVSAEAPAEPVPARAASAPVPAVAVSQILGSSRMTTPAKLVVATAGVVERAEPAPAPAPPAHPGSPSLKGFATTASSTESRFHITPKLLRKAPMPREFGDVVLASPLPSNVKPEPQRKPEPQPALQIHTWKAEIASCPWDPSRRLVRFRAQVPVEQNGIQHQEQDYKLVAKFDPFHVQAFRLVGEKHMPPNDAGTQATRFAWYEIVPNRNFSPSPDRPVTIGTISIEQPRGAQAQAQDLRPLSLVDRGSSWQEKGEDFAFETAMIGWSLLLQGTENIGNLNYKLVLDLAEQNRSEDPKGEQAKFIQVVKQAQRSVGL